MMTLLEPQRSRCLYEMNVQQLSIEYIHLNISSGSEYELIIFQSIQLHVKLTYF